MDVRELMAGIGHVIPDDRGLRRRGRLPQIAGLPSNADTGLITRSVAAGCHVFLTRDRQILAKRPGLERYGLVPLKPTELLDELALAGDLSPTGADGGICDTHKWVHLRRLVDEDYAG